MFSVAAGIKQKKTVDKMVRKVRSSPHICFTLLFSGTSKNVFSVISVIQMQFLVSNFAVMLFHYDGVVDQWKDLDWSSSVIHISAINQTKW